MKLYHSNLLALGLLFFSWLVIRLGYSWLPKSWEAAIWHFGFLVYLTAFIGLGWGSIRSIRSAMGGALPWSQMLLMVGVTVLQGLGTLLFFIVVLAEGFTSTK